MNGKKVPTCLIVEDSSFDQEKLRRIMNHSFPQLQVEIAGTIAHARTKMAEYQITVILLDNSLPDGTGANFAIELRKDAAFRNIPIIMVSDWPTPFMFSKAEQAAVAHVVNKSDFGARYVHNVLAPKRKVARHGT
ncbi:MAG: response regulator [Pseudomonadota bacterium]